MQDGGERKRDRSDESCDASTESEMTTARMQTCSFNPTMKTIKVTNVRKVYATTFRDFDFDHGNDLVCNTLANMLNLENEDMCFARAVCDERNGTLFPHWYAFRIHQWLR